MSKKDIYQLNYAAILEIFQAAVEKRKPSPVVLKAFEGYGMLKEILLDISSEWNKNDSVYKGHVKDLHDLIDKYYPVNGFKLLNSLKNNTLTGYYTPLDIAEVISGAMLRLVKEKGDVTFLEPSCGSGRFISSIINECDRLNVSYLGTGVEKDRLSSTVASGIFNEKKNITIINDSFESANLFGIYDLVIGNFPFGAQKVYDHLWKRELKNSVRRSSEGKIHNYFAVKSLDLVKPDGVLCFLTSTGFADSGEDKIREHMVKNAELISVMRLPDDTFLGTKVNSDLFLFKKRFKEISINDLSELEKSFLNTEKIIVNDLVDQGGVVSYEINKVFIRNGLINERVLGALKVGYFHNKRTAYVASITGREGLLGAISNQFDYDINRIVVKKSTTVTIKFDGGITLISPSYVDSQLDLFSSLRINLNPVINVFPKQKENALLTIPDDKYQEIKMDLRENNIIVVDGIVGRLKFSEDGPALEPLYHQNSSELQRYMLGSIVLHNYKKLVRLETNGFSEKIVADQRLNLNLVYDDFFVKFGAFNNKANKSFIELDPDGFDLLQLEVNLNGDYVKADIFTKSTFNLTFKSLDNIHDIFDYSLNQLGYVDIENIQRYTTGLDFDQTVKLCLDANLIFPNPVLSGLDLINFQPSDQVIYAWVVKDEFLSGPVREKIRQIEYNGLLNGANEEHLAMLRAVEPKWLTIEEIDVELGEPWIPIEIFNLFAQEHFEADVGIFKSSSSNTFNVKFKTSSNIDKQEYKVNLISGAKYTGKHVLQDALAGLKPKFTYKVYIGDVKKTYVDHAGSSSAGLKIDKINLAFKSFISGSEEYSDALESIYNALNGNVQRTYNVDHLRFPGLQNFTLEAHQKEAIWHNVLRDGGLNDHIVGAGKTLVIAASVMEMKRLNISKKSLIIALKANAEQISNEFLRAYPLAKVLCPSDGDFTPKKRRAFFQKIINNNWDAVIMSHEQFSAIPQNREIMIDTLTAELANLRYDALEMSKNGFLDKRVEKGLQIRMENREAEINRLSDSINKDPNILSFEKFGFDHLFVDEAHEFKNLVYSTRFNRVAGLGPAAGSAKALNLLYAVRTIQGLKGGDKGVTFLTGTSLSNSLVEMYSWFKYLIPSELEKRGMSNFDSFARTFALVSTEYELGVTGEVKIKERFRRFLKVPELAALYRSFTHVANDNNIKLDKPKAHHNMVSVEPTKELKEFNKKLLSALNCNDFSFFGKSFDDKQMSAKMLIATNIATKLSLDLRTIDPSLSESTAVKLLTCAENIYKEYSVSNEYNGTQIVFCDIATPGSKTSNLYNSYDALKNILMNHYAIPGEEIQFIHSWDNTRSKKKEFSSKFNKGEIRIAFGSTKKLGTGWNIQERIVALHNLDITWTPKDFNQRVGRGERQGNWACKVHKENKLEVYNYATVGTLDAYRYFLVDLKQKFIDQVKNNNITVRSIDEGDMDENGGVSPAAFIAQLSGKPELLEKAKIDAKISQLLTKINVLKNDYFRSVSSKATAEQKLKHYSTLLVSLEKDQKLYDPSLYEGFYPLKINNKEFNTQKELGDAINYIANPLLSKEFGDYLIAEDLNFKLVLRNFYDEYSINEKSKHKMFMVSKITGHEYGEYRLSVVPGITGRIPLDALSKIESELLKTKQEIEKNQKLISDEMKIVERIDLNQFNIELNNLNQESMRLQILIESNSLDGDIYDKIITCIVESNYDEIKDILTRIDVEDKFKEFKLFIENHPSSDSRMIRYVKNIYDDKFSKNKSISMN
jgi:N12 class adenine-specific DNA methylase